MSLTPSVAASPISAAYLTYTATSTPAGNYQQIFADSYHSYSIQGQLSASGGVAGSEVKSIISSFMSGLGGNTTPNALAVVFANYWATCLLVPGAGAVSVVNDAASKVSAFEAAITSTLTDSDTKPYFQNLISNIQSMALPQITWTVTLTDPPYTRIETVS